MSKYDELRMIQVRLKCYTVLNVLYKDNMFLFRIFR